MPRGQRRRVVFTDRKVQVADLFHSREIWIARPGSRRYFSSDMHGITGALTGTAGTAITSEMADAGGASPVLPMETAAGAAGQPRFGGLTGTRNAGDCGKPGAANTGRADAARSDASTFAAVPTHGGIAFFRDPGPPVRGSRGGTGFGGGVYWIHSAEMHRAIAAAS